MLTLISVFACVPPVQAASVTFSTTKLTATVNGTSVTAVTTIKASSNTTVQLAGVCARTSKGANVDFPKKSNIQITTSGTTITTSQTLSPGTYSYFACVELKNVWYDPGAVQNFTVTATTPTPTPTVALTITPTPTITISPTATPSPTPTVTPTPTPTGSGSGVLSHWQNALANRSTQAVTWLAIGDSITEGQGASAENKRWTDLELTQLRNTYSTAGVTGGIGYLPGWYATYDESEWVPYTSRTGTISNVENYPSFGLRGLKMSSGSSQTYTVTGTSADLYYYITTSGGKFTYQVDQNTAVTVNDQGTNNPNSHAIINFSSAGTHTIVIKDISGTDYVEGIMVYNGDENTGIRLVNAAHTGYTSSDFESQRSGLNLLDQYVHPDLVTIMLGANDYLHATASPTQVKANIESEIANIYQLFPTNPPSVVVGLNYGLDNLSSTSGYTWDQYAAAIKSIPTDYPTVGLLDFSSMGNATPGGQWSSDGLHPSDLGQQTMANITTSYLTTNH